MAPIASGELHPTPVARGGADVVWPRQTNGSGTVDDTNAQDSTPEQARPRTKTSSKAIPYGSDEIGSFFSDEWENGWEINHTVTSLPR